MIEKNETAMQDMGDVLKKLMEYPNIWAVGPVDVVPEKWLECWSVFKVTHAQNNPEAFAFHFVGWNVRDREGAVSSKIMQFDPQSMSGVTNSGRVYQLMGVPGSDPDADYVLRNWARMCQVDVVDATQEFITQYGICMEHIALMSGVSSAQKKDSKET